MNYSSIVSAFLPKIGWRQNLNPNDTQLVDLFTSTSGLYYNEVHPLLTFNNLEALCFDDTDITYPAYSGVATYSFGDIVADGGTNYLYINQTASSGNATNDTTYWREYEVLTETLRRETEAGIIKAIKDWFSSKKMFNTSNNLLEYEYLIQASGNVTDTNSNESKIRFIEITPLNSRSLKYEPLQIGLQFDSADTIPIKIYKSGQKTAIDTQSLNYTDAGSMQWFDLDVEFEAGFRYWVTYDESAIPGTQSINGMRDYEYKNRGSRYSSNEFFPLGRFYKAVAGYHTEGNSELWDLSNNTYILDNNYGINIKSRVVCDYTQFIIDQADVFYPAIMLSVGMYMLRKFAFNPEAVVDRHESNLRKEDILYEIDGDSQGETGSNRRLSKQYERAIKSIQFDTSGIDEICLPCKRRGLKYRTT